MKLMPVGRPVLIASRARYCLTTIRPYGKQKEPFKFLDREKIAAKATEPVETHPRIGRFRAFASIRRPGSPHSLTRREGEGRWPRPAHSARQDPAPSARPAPWRVALVTPRAALLE